MGEYILKSREDEEIPREVFYQCLWIVKDIDRLRELASETQEKYILSEEGLYVGNRARKSSDNSVGTEAAFKIDCIYRALSQVPEEYRKSIIDSIRFKKSDDSAHENTLKQWKQRFILNMARELRLI